MKLNLSKESDNLRSRMIYGFSGFLLMLGGILWQEWSYFVVFAVICVFCLIEFYNLLLFDNRKPLKGFGIVIGMLIYSISFLNQIKWADERAYFMLYPLFSTIFIIKLYDPTETNPFENIALTLLGIIYAAIPFSALHIMVYSKGFYSYQIILGTFFIIWINDITAYFIGYRYGKHKLFPRISPKKSWEGSAGGVFSCAVMVILLSYYFQDLTAWQWVGVALIVVIVSTYGDLVESMLKRSLKVKDSSEAIPGHGGFLDRFDGLLLAAPFIALFLRLF